jgi:DNA-binding NarL/FixJ family response regulator
MRQPVRVVLADDHDAFVEGLGMVLSAEDDLEVVALAGDGASALQAVLTHRPDVLVVDTQMPGPAVTELVRLVGQAEPATRVLLLAEDAHLEPSTGPDPGGPAGMTRAVSARELAEAIRAVAAGFRVVMADPPAPRPDGRDRRDGRDGRAASQPGGPGASEREGGRRPGGMLGAVHSPQSPHSPGRPQRDDHAELLLRSLSERERQILALLARGYSNRRIADACVLSLNTVRTHVQNVLVKLGVHSKLEAAALAVRQGLVSIEDPIA